MSAPDSIDTPSLLLTWIETPWDTAIMGAPVLQIGHIELRGAGAVADFAEFEATRDALGACLVSCRLPHDHLRESMFLESRGFRFIEMAYAPELDRLSARDLPEGGLEVARATADDLPAALAIAEHAFRSERFHVDPRLDPALGDLRYCNWVRSSLDHPSQRLFLVRDGTLPVAFFVTEMLADGTCYWHLNAVSPQVQGRDYGRRAWISMLRQAREAGAARVRTSIVARNYRVLNLYARLGFSFPAPLMTFHWARPA